MLDHLGHTIENCNNFKFRVQELIDSKWLIFKENDSNTNILITRSTNEGIKGSPKPRGISKYQKGVEIIGTNVSDVLGINDLTHNDQVALLGQLREELEFLSEREIS